MLLNNSNNYNRVGNLSLYLQRSEKHIHHLSDLPLSPQTPLIFPLFFFLNFDRSLFNVGEDFGRLLLPTIVLLFALPETPDDGKVLPSTRLPWPENGTTLGLLNFLILSALSSASFAKSNDGFLFLLFSGSALEFALPSFLLTSSGAFGGDVESPIASGAFGTGAGSL